MPSGDFVIEPLDILKLLRCRNNGLDTKKYRGKQSRQDYVQAYNYAHRAAAASAKRKYRYGISEAEYQHLLTIQEGRCAICHRTPEEAKEHRALCVEHDHASGVIRGLVCTKCNRHLGWYEQNTASIGAYLERGNI